MPQHGQAPLTGVHSQYPPPGWLCPAKTGKASARTSMKTTTNRFIWSSLQAGFYQQVVSSVLSFQELGNSLVRYAENARAFRLTDKVQEASQILINLPLNELQSIGSYYL